jgi:SAM-dependent methyltransferase
MLKLAKRTARSILPNSLLSRWSEWRIRQMVDRYAKINANRSAAEVFDDVYRLNQWGGQEGDHFSGTGSLGIAANDYISLVNEFIVANNIGSVLDIGCGDFRIGKHIICAKYVGIDVSQTMIDANTETYSDHAGSSFLCMDAAGPSPLPSADLCLIRQVFQHLSNAQIQAIITKLGQFRWTMITEHQLALSDLIAPNLDKVHGPDTRLFRRSGVYLDEPPFNIDVEMILEAEPGSPVGDIHARGKIRTFLLHRKN